MLDLRKTTFIIPIKIEHEDRYRNAKATLGFLNKHFKTNVFIYEASSDGKSKLDFLKSLKNLKIKTWIIQEQNSFHRTKYLNEMLEKVKTPVVANYDIDVIFDPSNLQECQQSILEGGVDVIYPYENGQGQYQVLPNFDYEGFERSEFSVEYLKPPRGYLHLWTAECGHCIFFKTSTYRKWSGEHEGFVAYGPEDKERMYRFQTLGCNVQWRPGRKVYHFEHHRGDDSWVTNPYFKSNWELFDSLKGMSPEALSEYYRSPGYSVRYKNIGGKQNPN